MNWKAEWIWTSGRAPARNARVMFRKTFNHPGGDATLYISADSRYRLWLNGETIGDGPVRSHPWKQRYDIHDATGLLRKGKNIVAVLVTHEGIGTFQYIAGRGGLLCEIKAGNRTIAATDASWLSRRARAWVEGAPRISIQQGHTEQYDARLDIPDWTLPGFNDKAWDKTEVVCRAENGRARDLPWSGLTPREIPFLTEERVYPKRVMSARITRPPDIAWGFELQPYTAPGDRSINKSECTGFMAGIVNCPKACSITVKAHDINSRAGVLYVNGRALPPTRGNTNWGRVRLKKGHNVFLLTCQGGTHNFKAALAMNSPAKLSAGQWIFHKTDPALAPRIRSPRDLAALDCPKRTMAARDVMQTSVCSLFEYAEPVPGLEPRLENIDALAAPGRETAVIHPSKNGDVEITLDFGAELSGFWEYEVEAPAGAILDFYGFEAFALDGSIQWGQRDYGYLENTLRCVTRAGRQQYRGFVRHGFRYMLLSIRGASGPVRIRNLATVFSSYPHVKRGSFQCSDELLNKIWDMSALTLRCCSEDTFVDCPSREQTFWVGDARNEALVHYAAVGDGRLPARCWRLVGESLDSPTRLLRLSNCQCPSGWEIEIPAWTFLWMKACEEYFIYTGDKAGTAQFLPALMRSAETIARIRDKHGLVESPGWNFFDWAPIDYQPVTVLNSMLAIWALNAAARLAEEFGGRKNAARCRQIAAELKSAVNKRAWNEEKQAFIDSIHPDGRPSRVFSQQTQIIAFLCDAATAPRMRLLEKHILEETRGFVLSGSPFMDFFMFEAWARLGRHGKILERVRKNWGEMLEHGATTCWETYRKFSADRGEAVYTGSHCHAWSAGPLFFMAACQLGVRPLAPGYAQALIAPEPLDLAWARGRVPVPAGGEIQVAWKRSGRRFTLEVGLPRGVSGKVLLPAQIVKGRKPLVTVNGKTTRAAAAKPFPLEAGSSARFVVGD